MRKVKEEVRYAPPTKAQVSHVGDVGKKEIVQFVRGYATRHFDSVDTARYCMIPFMNGFLFEIHEAGGTGKGHLTSVVNLLNEGKECAWFQVGRRVFSVRMRDGFPKGSLLTDEQSRQLVENHPDCRAKPVDAMRDVLPKGEKMLAVGVASFLAGTTFLSIALGYDVATKIEKPIVSAMDITETPHRQWTKIEGTPRDLFVDALRFDAAKPEGRRWTLSRKPVAQLARAETSSAPPQSVQSQPAPPPVPNPVEPGIAPSPVPIGSPVQIVPPAPIPMPGSVSGMSASPSPPKAP